MSTEQRRITLTENDEGRWTAREDPAGVTARGETPEAALDALGEVAASETTDRDADAADPFGELMQATEDIRLEEDELDAMVRDSKDAWSSVE